MVAPFGMSIIQELNVAMRSPSAAVDGEADFSNPSLQAFTRSLRATARTNFMASRFACSERMISPGSDDFFSRYSPAT